MERLPAIPRSGSAAAAETRATLIFDPMRQFDNYIGGAHIALAKDPPCERAICRVVVCAGLHEPGCGRCCT